MVPLDYVSEDGFPASVRRLLNQCASRLNRNWDINFEDVPEAKILESDEKVSLIFPRSLMGGGSLPGGFKCASNGAKIRVFLGIVQNILPSGMSLGDSPPYLIAPVGVSGRVCLGVVVSTLGDANDGLPISAFIQCFVAMPDDTLSTYYWTLGTYTVTGGNASVTPGGEGNGIGDQSFNLCGGLGGNAEFWRA